MLIVPNEKIRKYVSYDAEKCEWIHDPDMPKDFKQIFDQYVNQMKKNTTMPIEEKEEV